MAGEKILLVDDSPEVVQGLTLALAEAGYLTRSATDGPGALREFYSSQPDVILLDLMLPGMTGTEVCKRVRSLSDTPVIILSAVEDEAQKIYALTIGADDYVVKGTGIGELLARISACIRRQELNRTTSAQLGYADAALEIDFSRHLVRVGGKNLELTPIEFKLLAELVKHEGRPLSSNELLDAVWGPGFETDSLVKWHISRLRRKLSTAMRKPEMDVIVTRRGYGYAYLEQQAA
jgi:DNA-binding response OmpR family regulator